MTAQLTSALGVPHGIMGDVATAGIRQTLVGRDAELAELSSLLGVRPPDLDPSPTPRAVLLAGDAGVGKTRLLTELRDLAVTDGWQVVAGHCLDFGDSALPYLPFSEVMGRLATDLPDVVETVSGVHPALGRLQPGRRMLSGARRGRRLRRPRRPVRGDALAALGGRRQGPAAAGDRGRPLGRPVHPRHDQLPVLPAVRGPGRHRGQSTAPRTSTAATRCAARSPSGRGSAASTGSSSTRSSDTEVRTLVRELHPDPITEADLSDIVTRAEGNAFFVEELVGTTWGGRVPEDLAEVLLVRLDRLDDSSRQVVRAMSVAGRQVSHGLLAEASGVPADALDQALRAAVESHVVVTSQDRYSFRHALLAEAIYDDLLPGERVRLHASYAEALRDGRGRGTAAELARHALAARDLPTALEASIRAGDEAMAVGGPEEAAHHFQQALELVVDPALADPVDVSALVLKTADALVATGMPHRAAALVEKHLEATTDAEPDAMRARLHAYVAHTLSLYDNDQDWRSHLDAARALTPEEPTPDRARLLGDPRPGAVDERQRGGQGRRHGGARPGRDPQPAAGGERRDHHAGRAQPQGADGRAGGRARGRRPPRPRDRARSTPSCGRSTSSAAATRTAATSPRRSTRSAGPATGPSRPAPRGRRGPSTRGSSRRRSPTSPASGTGC